MKAIKVLLIVALLYAGSSMAGRPQRNGRVNGVNLNFRPVEQMLPGLSKGDYQYKLDGFILDDDYEIYNFHYNGDKLIATYSEVVDEFKLYDSLHYNEAGQMVRLSGWQWLNNQWVNVYYVDYTYNAQGLLASRSNYNYGFSGNSWELGGVYEYNYNANGQLVLTELTLAGTNYIFQKVEYTYNNGLLQRELWSINFSGMEMEPMESLTYKYIDGRVQTIYDSTWNGECWEHTGYETFSYDATGNCLQHSTFDHVNRESTRSEYEYSSTPLSTTLMPYHPEMTRPETYNNTNIFTVEHWYQMDANHVFRYFGDYVYNYSSFVSIAEADNAPSLSVYPNPASSRLYVDAPAHEAYRLFDAAGRMVQQGLLSSDGIDVSALSAGLYRLMVGQHAQSVVIK